MGQFARGYLGASDFKPIFGLESAQWMIQSQETTRITFESTRKHKNNIHKKSH
jgi:hypothetical protein